MQARHLLQPIIAEAVHIDSVRIGHRYRVSDLPPPKELKILGFDLSFKIRGKNAITTAKPNPTFSTSNDPYIKITSSSNPHSYSGISVSCSLAKLVNGNGLGEQTDDDIECALDAIEDFIRTRLGMDFDAPTAKVSRFDVNGDFRVGEERIKLYLNSLSRPNSRLVQSTFGDSTNYFYNGSRAFAVYGKREEMENQYKNGKATLDDVAAADGLLRVETRLKNTESIKRFAKGQSIQTFAKDLFTKAVASTFMSEALQQLDLDQEKISVDAREHVLIQAFKKDAAEMLGILQYRGLLGEDFWKQLGWNQQMYYRKKKELVSANLWNVSPAERLPALVVMP
jgi:hypothetical protein